MYISSMQLLIPSVLDSERNVKVFGELPTTVSPELDTIRLYIPAAIVDLNRFIPDTSEKMFYSYEWNNDTNEWAMTWEKYRNDQKNSWWGTMQITREFLPLYTYDKVMEKKVVCGKLDYIGVEYSVAKWYNVTNGVNNYQSNTWQHVIFPVLSAFKKMYVENYLKWGNFNDFCKWVYEKAILRRFDLSFNFKVVGASVPECIGLLSRIPFRRQTGKPYEKENMVNTCKWGNAHTDLNVMFYHKAEEQKNYFSKMDFHYREQKLDWYKKHKHLFENVLRFEMQFKGKFFKNRKLNIMGKSGFDKIIPLGVEEWRKTLTQFNNIMCGGNFKPSEEITALERVCALIDTLPVSRTVKCSRQRFICDCVKFGWKEVKSQLGRNSFCQLRKWCRDFANYDVKVHTQEVVITADNAGYVYNIAHIENYLSKQIRNLKITAAPAYVVAV